VRTCGGRFVDRSGIWSLVNELELRRVRKTFGRTVAVAGIDLAVQRAEFVGLLGPSGCGKTTTLRAVAGFERPDSGEVVIKGRNVTHLPPHRRDIGIVFQSYALFPHMTVFQNVAYGLRVRGVPKNEIVRRVADALELVHLGELEHRYPRQLSGGQQQRVALARAVVIQPTVLLLDEPLSNLDAKLRQEMRSELRRLQRRLEIATIFVTHDQEEALSMADRIVVMNEGRVEQIGTAEEIYNRPRTRFVAGFIGMCNFLPGQVVSVAQDHFRFRAGGLEVAVALDGALPAPGTQGTLSVRPEVIRILGADESPPAAVNVVDGKVREITYLGAFRHYRVELSSGHELIVYQQSSGTPPVQEAGRVRVAWEAGAGSFQLEGAAP
jgi:spermidine/putrescine ABC transporter ATP-binding subunit